MKPRTNWPIVIVMLLAMSMGAWSVFGKQQTTVSNQWEYTIRVIGNPEGDAPTTLNRLGAEGWELVSVYDNRAYLKRIKK